MENLLTLPSLANKYFNSLGDENDEPIYTYNDEYIRGLVRQSLKRCRCSNFNQKYKSIISDDVFNIISTELNNNGNVCEFFGKYCEDMNKPRKILEEEHDSQFENYRDNFEDDKTKYVNDTLSKLTVHNKLKKIVRKEVGMDFDGTSLYANAMWDKSLLYPKKESGFAFKSHFIDVYVERSIIKLLNKMALKLQF